MPKNFGSLVRAAALAGIRAHAGVQASLDTSTGPTRQVFDRQPALITPPTVATTEFRLVRKRAVTKTQYEYTGELTCEVIADPFRDTGPTADALTEDVIEALETAFSLDGYGIMDDGQLVTNQAWNTIEGSAGEDLHQNLITLTITALATE